jgi:hypothetical protein
VSDPEPAPEPEPEPEVALAPEPDDDDDTVGDVLEPPALAPPDDEVGLGDCAAAVLTGTCVGADGAA